jgi:formylglycine-generating enzyme
MNHTIVSHILSCALSLIALRSASAVTMAYAPVGNPGNAADSTHYGAVSYSYSIGTYDVTNSQYAEFLNTKDPAGANTFGLWNAAMGTSAGISFNSGNPSGSKYVLIAGRQDHPVNCETWYDAIRFANWLNNGQRNGDTETGAYTLLGGGPTPTNGLSITRNAGATVFLPSIDEWYKAACYDPRTTAQGGPPSDSHYWHYATSSNAPPIASGPTSLANHANYNNAVGNLTDVGAYSGTTSPSGAFDMNGNLDQWLEPLGDSRGDDIRVLLGGRFDTPDVWHTGVLQAVTSTLVSGDIGFRVATVPEPSAVILLAIGGLALAGRAVVRRARWPA